MSDSLYDALHEFLEGSGDNATLDLVAASKDTDLSGLSVALDALGIDPDGTFVVRQAKLTQPTSDTVLLGGNVAYGTPGGPQSTADLSMNGSQPDGNLFVIAPAQLTVGSGSSPVTQDGIVMFQIAIGCCNNSRVHP